MTTTIELPDAKDIRGVIRTATQAIFSGMLAYGPAVAVLRFFGLDGLSAEQLTAGVFPVVMALYWALGNYLQGLDVVQRTAPLRWVLAVLMGGSTPPNYENPDQYLIVKTDPDGVETQERLLDYVKGEDDDWNDGPDAA